MRWTMVHEVAYLRGVEADSPREALELLIESGTVKGPPPNHVERVTVVPTEHLHTFSVLPGKPTIGDS